MFSSVTVAAIAASPVSKKATARSLASGRLQGAGISNAVKIGCVQLGGAALDDANPAA